MAWSWGPTACGRASFWEPLCEIIYIYIYMYIELLLRPPWRGLAPPASPTRTSPSSKSRAYNARASLHARWPPPEFSTSPLNPEVCQVSAKAFRGRASRIERDRAHILATGLASRKLWRQLSNTWRWRSAVCSGLHDPWFSGLD